MKIALLYICTGEYQVFWKDFFESFEKNFLIDCEKHYFVFTDAEKIYNEDKCERIHKIYQKNLGWPGNTLFRYRMFNSIESELKSFDYVFFMNANIVCVDKVDKAEFLPYEEKLLVVQHPGFFNVPNYRFPYERNRKSRAYIPYRAGEVYICGGVNGGETEKFLEVIRELKNRIDEDFSKKVIALWHDESQINRYIIDYPTYKLLSPSYCYPEGWNIPFEKKLVVLDKSKKIQVNKIKNSKDYYITPHKLKVYIVCKFFDIYYFLKGKRK